MKIEDSAILYLLSAILNNRPDSSFYDRQARVA
jgi:hypothetical protein